MLGEVRLVLVNWIRLGGVREYYCKFDKVRLALVF